MHSKRDFKRYIQYTLYLSSILVIGWGFTSYKPFFLGMLLGTVISLFNLWLLSRRIERVGQAVVKGEKAYSLGMMSRFASAGFIVLIALQFPNHLNLIGVIIGLMSTYFILFIDYFVSTFIRRS